MVSLLNECALRLFDSFNNETTKINYQFVSKIKITLCNDNIYLITQSKVNVVKKPINFWLPIFSSPEPKAHSEFLGYPWSGVRRSQFQTSSPKPLAQSKPNFMWSLLGKGERKFVRGIRVT